ncbi:hypothetical protein [Algoriphagus boritolerans]|uniref:hypothetical protein n=1 Tax=Algoriphagus boritolerans TaxID=308111 RepID=UPI000AA5D053
MPQIAKVCTEGLHLHTGILKKKSSSIVDIIESYYSVFQGPLTTTEGNMDAIVEELEIQTKTKIKLNFRFKKKISGGEIRVSPKEKLSLKLTYYISKKSSTQSYFFYNRQRSEINFSINY